MSSEEHHRHNPGAKLEQTALNFSPSQAATTVYSGSLAGRPARPNTESGDQAMSGTSVYTYTSADASQFRKEEAGRLWNVLNETYVMPTDDEEYERLDKQHITFLLALGGLYPAPDVVRAVLAPEEGKSKKVLDLGCGSGVWSIAMAREFPHAQIIGVDLAPIPAAHLETLPSNVTFEIDDINPGLHHYEGQFDVVHCRSIGGGLNECRKSIHDAQGCLKPGGILLAIEADFDIVAEDMINYVHRASDTNEGGSWCARILYEMQQATLLVGQKNIQAMAEALDEGFWEHPLMDPETCQTANIYVPVGPWVEDPNSEQAQRLRYMGSLLRQNVYNGLRAFQPVIRKAGIPQDVLTEWTAKGDNEIGQQRARMWVRWALAWGRRRDPGVDLTSIFTPPRAGDRPQMPPYPYFVLYDSQEKALVARNEKAKRREQVPIPSLPPS